MKLSDAIILGSTVHEQAFGSYRVVDLSTGEIRTCALGAAAEVIGQWPGPLWMPLEAAFPVLRQKLSLPLPDAPEGAACVFYAQMETYTLADIITRLNDYLRWTRERIAEWVALKERQLENMGVVVDAGDLDKNYLWRSGPEAAVTGYVPAAVRESDPVMAAAEQA